MSLTPEEKHELEALRTEWYGRLGPYPPSTHQRFARFVELERKEVASLDDEKTPNDKAEKPSGFRPLGKSWAEANAETRKERWVCELDDLGMRLDEGNASNAEIECYRALMPFEMLRRIVLAGQGQTVCPHEVVRLFFALRGHDYTAKADGDFVWLSCCTDDEPMTRVPSAAFLQGVDRVANSIIADTL